MEYTDRGVRDVSANNRSSCGLMGPFLVWIFEKTRSPRGRESFLSFLQPSVLQEDHGGEISEDHTHYQLFKRIRKPDLHEILGPAPRDATLLAGPATRSRGTNSETPHTLSVVKSNKLPGSCRAGGREKKLCTRPAAGDAEDAKESPARTYLSLYIPMKSFQRRSRNSSGSSSRSRRVQGGVTDPGTFVFIHVFFERIYL